MILDGVADVVETVGLALELEVDPHDLAAVHHPLDVVLEPEDGHALGGVVDPDSLEDTRTVVECVCEDMDLRILPVDELAVQPDLFRLVHRITLEMNRPRDVRSPV